MEELINDICQKTGIDRATAEKISGYLKDNITRLPELMKTAQTGGLKGVVGGFAGKVSDVMHRRT